jgi:hypothetical protein
MDIDDALINFLKQAGTAAKNGHEVVSVEIQSSGSGEVLILGNDANDDAMIHIGMARSKDFSDKALELIFSLVAGFAVALNRATSDLEARVDALERVYNAG